MPAPVGGSAFSRLYAGGSLVWQGRWPLSAVQVLAGYGSGGPGRAVVLHQERSCPLLRRVAHRAALSKPNRRLQRTRLRVCLRGGRAFVHHRGVPRSCSPTGVPLKRSVRCARKLLGLLTIVVLVTTCKAGRPNTPMPASSVAARPTSAVIKPVVRTEVKSTPETVSSDFTPPELLRKVDPDWARLGSKQRVLGPNVFQAVIDESGHVANVKVLRGGDPEIDALILAAIRQWQYRPATRAGRPVAVEVFVVFNLDPD